MLLAGTLAIAPRLVGIDLAHPLQEVLGVGFFHLGFPWSLATTAAGCRRGRTLFLGLIWHMLGFRNGLQVIRRHRPLYALSIAQNIFRRE